MNIKILEIAYHRNGVAGNGFHAVRFKFKPANDWMEFLGIVFEEQGSVAVVSIDRLPIGISVPLFAWRGDQFEGELREAIKSEQEKKVELPL